MIDVVYAYGGQVVKFGGDAITCAFVKSQIGKSANQQIGNLQTEVVRACTVQACACALAMQDGMAAFRAVETRGGTFELRMKIGVSAGPVQFLSVGGPGDRQPGIRTNRLPGDGSSAPRHRQADAV